MRDFEAIALFCDDIRDEKSGLHSLMGVLGDTVAVASFPGAVPRLAIYVRIHLDVHAEPREFQIFVTAPDGAKTLLNTVPKQMVSDTLSQARAAGNPLAGIYSNLIASPFPVQRPGRFLIELAWENGSQIISGLEFILAPDGSFNTQQTG